MARTPSMSQNEAEAALGPRGSLYVVTAQNKPLVRKWLTARGMPGLYAAAMPMKLLQACYNDENVFERQMKVAREAQADDVAQANDNDSSKAKVIANDVDDKGNAVHTPVNATVENDGTAGATLATLVAPYLGNSVLADVMAKVDAKLADVHITRVEVTRADSSVHVVEGAQHKMLASVLQAVAQNIPVLTVGPAGSGKSTCAEQVAEALALKFYIQGAATGTHEYLGYKDGAGQYHSTPFREAFEHGGLFVAEELDSGDAGVPLVLNAGLANGHMAFPDRPEAPVERHPDFRIIANANTYLMGADRVYVGRNQLDGATIDRFCFIDWNYDETLERKLAGNDAWVDRVQALRHAATEEKARIIISPRASINGAKMIAAGWSRAQCEEAFIWRGIDNVLRGRIESRCR